MKPNQSNFTSQYRFCYTDSAAQPSLQYNSISSSARSPLRLVWPKQSSPVSGSALSSSQLADVIAEIQAKEKRLLGQELHDNVNQLLSMAKLFVEMLRPADIRDKDIQEKTIEFVKEAISEIRKISGELVAPKQKEKGLIDSIASIVDDINFSTKINIRLTHSGDIECLGQDKKTALLRIVQEQLKNVVKYSRAKNVLVELHLRNDEIVLSVNDDGIGFDPQARCSGIGLTNIAERTQSYNGTVQLQTSEGNGCSLNVSIPAA